MEVLFSSAPCAKCNNCCCICVYSRSAVRELRPMLRYLPKASELASTGPPRGRYKHSLSPSLKRLSPTPIPGTVNKSSTGESA